MKPSAPTDMARRQTLATKPERSAGSTWFPRLSMMMKSLPLPLIL